MNSQERSVMFRELAKLDPKLTPGSFSWRWLADGYERGYARGRQDGREEGRAQGIILRQLRARFGDLPPWAEQRLNNASWQELDDLSERVLQVEDLNTFFASGDSSDR